MVDHGYLEEVLILLLALLIFVPVFQRFRLGTVIAYLVAGTVIGPSGLGLIESVEATQGIAELGVVFLLFAVGLEVRFQRLRLFGARAFGLAAAQIVITTMVFAAFAWAFGMKIGAALVIGGILCLSSTAVVLQMLAERGQMISQLGRTAIAVLLVQDLAVGPMIVLISTAGENSGGVAIPLAIAGLKFLAVLTAIVVVERTVLRPLLRAAAGVAAPEVFTGATLLLVLGTGWATHQAGLSMALGAFLGGLMVADTEFRHQVQADIQPFRHLLLGLFFVTVGMTIDLGYTIANVGSLALILVALVIVKAAIVAGLALSLGQTRSRALALGGLLAQGSEFAFVLLTLAAGRHVLPAEIAQLLVVAVGLSMAVTPLGAMLVRALWPGARDTTTSSLGDLKREETVIRHHVVVAGFGQVGMAVARFLAGARVPVLSLDLRPKRVSLSRARGLRVFYGNAASVEVLRAAHVDQAQALVIAVPEPETAEQITVISRRVFSRDVRIFVRVPDEQWGARLRNAGADAVVVEGLTTALELAEWVMLFHRPEDETKM